MGMSRPEVIKWFKVYCWVLAVLFLFVLSLMGIFLKPRPWVWIFSFAMICLGMTSACFLPACIPMLIFWIRKDVKEYYGRTNGDLIVDE